MTELPTCDVCDEPARFMINEIGTEGIYALCPRHNLANASVAMAAGGSPGDDELLWTNRDILTIAHAFIHLPHTGDLYFEGGQIPKRPTPSQLAGLIEQLGDILKLRLIEGK